MGWHEHHEDVFAGCEMFFRPGYVANLTSSWIPALDGVAEKLAAGGRVADVGCGHGASTVLLAQAYPTSDDRRLGLPPGVRRHRAQARRRRRAGRPGPVRGGVRADFSGTGYDLVATFDCLHDMGDPVGAARHIRQALDADGTWLIVEPLAGDTLAENLNPVSRVYYSFSTFICVPAARSQPGGYTLGSQAGEAAIREVTSQAGFSRFRRAEQTPFNAVYEARP